MADVYTDGDTLFVYRGNAFIKIPADGDPTEVFSLPSTAIPLISEDDVDTEEAYNDGYDSGYSDGQDEGYTDYDLENEYERGYEEGFAAAQAEGEDEEPGE